MQTEPIKVSAFFDPRDEWPYVAITWGPMDGHLTAGEARDLAYKILACATDAEQSAFLVDFLGRVVGRAPGEIAILLQELNKWRKENSK